MKKIYLVGKSTQVYEELLRYVDYLKINDLGYLLEWIGKGGESDRPIDEIFDIALDYLKEADEVHVFYDCADRSDIYFWFFYIIGIARALEIPILVVSNTSKLKEDPTSWSYAIQKWSIR